MGTRHTNLGASWQKMQRAWACVWLSVTVLMFFPGASLLCLVSVFSYCMIPSGLKISWTCSIDASERQLSLCHRMAEASWITIKSINAVVMEMHGVKPLLEAGWRWCRAFLCTWKGEGIRGDLHPELGEHLQSSTVPPGSECPTTLLPLLRQE